MSGSDEAMWDRRSNTERDWESSDLDLVLQRSDCPACALASETEEAMMFWLATANVRDPDSIERIVGAGGLCAVHWANLVHRLEGDPGIAGTRLLALSLEKAKRDLRRGTVSEPRCPVCASIARRASEAISLLGEIMDRPNNQHAYASTFGLCQPHLNQMLRAIPQGRSATFLRVQERQLDRLLKELVGGEMDSAARTRSARRAITKLAGSLRRAHGSSEADR